MNQITMGEMEESRTNLSDNRRIIAIYTDIGRGHPSYLDSLLETLHKKGQRVIYRTVFEESDGFSLLAWKLVQRLYFIGGKGGITTKLYNWLRASQTDVSSDSGFLKILGRDLRAKYQDFRGVCLVAHPVVARILRSACRTWYVHGEIAAPAECAIKGVEKIFVPLEETKDKLISFGADPETIVVTGLMIEPRLVETAEKSFQDRLKRIGSNEPLTIGFFTSGAYPKEHIKKILWGVKSVIEQKMRAIIFTGTCPKKFEWFRKQMKKWGLVISEDTGEGSRKEKNGDVWLVTRKTRQAETQRTVELLPKMDAFVAAAHERTNWAVGLGLPMFVLFPLIGTFASLNFEFAQRQKVVYPLDSSEKAKNLGKIISELRQNEQLAQMAKKGFGVYKINGVWRSHVSP
ncbi:MAG: hypothetical protein KAW52_06070 [candidate division Zixibacteria bacterium]|nr:hypothetical protein [candidate division Zixibacteria bacterium]